MLYLCFFKKYIYEIQLILFLLSDFAFLGFWGELDPIEFRDT